MQHVAGTGLKHALGEQIISDPTPARPSNTSDMGCQVRFMDNFATRKGEIAGGVLYDKYFTLIKDNIQDLEACLVACNGVDYVLHQATWGSVPECQWPVKNGHLGVRTKTWTQFETGGCPCTRMKTE